MKKILFTCFVLFFALKSYSQQGVGINLTGNSPNAKSILDVDIADKGALLPRVDLTVVGTGGGNLASSNPEGLIVFNTNAAFSTGKGYYYWVGGAWNRLFPESAGITSFIQNQTGVQASSNFNISGAGVIGTNLTVGGNSVTTGANAVTGLTTLNGGLIELGNASINTSGAGTTTIGNGTNAVSVTGNTTLNNSAGAATTNLGTGTTTGAVAIGNSANTVALSGGTNNVTGTTNINASNNSITNINTGSSTSNVNLGGASNNVVLPKLTTAGIVTNTAAGILGTTSTVPLGNGGTGANLSATGGTGQYLKQAGVGAGVTVGTIAAADLPGTFSGFANPTASLGLTANNGVATTAMRSDATPALSQSIAPTWTGIHTFSNATNSALFTGGNVGINFNTPIASLEIRSKTVFTSTAYNPVLNLGPSSANAELATFYHSFASGQAYLGLDVKDPSSVAKRPFVMQEYGGNVGVGLNSPTQLLTMGSTTNGTTVRFSQRTPNGGGITRFNVIGNDPTNGPYTSWSNTLDYRFSTATDDGGGGWVERMRITSSGNVQIANLGTTSAVYTDASRNLTTTAPTSGTIGYWSRTGTTLSTATGGDNVTVTGTGTFGSGAQAATTYPLAVNLTTGTSTIQLGSGRGTDPTLRFVKAGAWGRIGASAGLSLWANGNADVDDTPQLHIASGGNVGIGTSSPGAKLDAFFSSTINTTTPGLTAYNLHLSPSNLTADFATGITFGSTNSAVQPQAGIYVQSSGAYGTKMYFGTTDAYVSGSKTRMMIDHLGNVGIGTIAPAAKLEILGTTATTILRNTVNTNYGGLRVYNDINSSVRALEIDYSGSTYASSLLTSGVTGEAASIATTGAYPLMLGTSNTARLTIASNGNVGIGTTNPLSRLHVRGGRLFLNAQAIDPQTAAYSGADLVIGDNTTTRNGYGGTNGSHIFLQSSDKSTITALDESNNLGQISYQNLKWTIGEAIGWGAQSIQFPGHVNGLHVGDASGNIVVRSLATSGNGIVVTNGNGVSGNPTYNLNYGSSLASAAGAGGWPVGNFGQFENHGTYTDFNTTPNFWGWNYVQGNTNAPNTFSTQWYRQNISLGANYAGRGAGGYSLELAYPRDNQARAGAWMRAVENGTIGSWVSLGQPYTAPTTSLMYPSEDDITWGATPLNSCVDDGAYTVNFGLNFVIDGTNYTSGWVSTNGILGFGSASSSSYTNTSLPASLSNDPMLFFHWDDDGTNLIRTVTYGTAPNRICLIHVNSSESTGCAGGASFYKVLITLHEGSNVMAVRYQSVGSNLDVQGQSATFGFQYSGGSSAKTIPLGFNTRLLDDNNSGF